MAAVLVAVLFDGFLTAPFWFDEQWRAYQIALPGLHMGLGDSYAPLSPTWVLLERALIQVLPTKELVLRLPELACGLLLGPAFYLLARKLMPRWIALVAALALIINPATIYYGTQMKTYVVEALATVVILLLWCRARRAERLSGRLGWYGAIVFVASFSVPMPFVVGPLFALDLVEGVARHRADRRALVRQVAGPLAAGAALLIYTLVVILPQSAAGYTINWRPYYAPHDLSALWSFLTSHAPTYLVGSVTGTPELDTLAIGRAPTGRVLSDLIDLVLFTLVVLGAYRVRRQALGRAVCAVAFGGLLLQFVGSWTRSWPFGSTRAAFFFVPVVYLLVGAGVAGAVEGARRAGLGRWVAAGALASVLAVGVLVTVRDISNDRRLHGDVGMVRLMSLVRPAVAAARTEYRPGTLVYVWLDGQVQFGPHGKGWTFYMNSYDWPSGVDPSPRIPLRATHFDGGFPNPNPELAAFLASHPRLRRLLVVGVGQMDPVLLRYGFRLYWVRTYFQTCQVLLWVRRGPRRLAAVPAGARGATGRLAGVPVGRRGTTA